MLGSQNRESQPNLGTIVIKARTRARLFRLREYTLIAKIVHGLIVKAAVLLVEAWSTVKGLDV